MFEKISIIGRAAYAVCCLERFVKEQGYDAGEWQILLDKLWAFAEMEFVDEYANLVIDCNPDCILEFPDYHDAYGYQSDISERDFDALYQLYSQCEKVDTITLIMDGIDDMLSPHLYTVNEPPARESLTVMETELYPYLQTVVRTMPPVEAFAMYSICDNHCWGNFHSREELTASLS